MGAWRGRLQARMDEAGPPTLTIADVPLSGPSLWRGVVAWVQAFRAAGLGPGDRVVVALPSGPQLAVVVLAGLWDGLTLAPVAPGTDPVVAAATYDPRAAVLVAAGRSVSWAFRIAPDGITPPELLRPTGPPADGEAPWATHPPGAPTPEVRLLGPAASVPSWVALSDANVRHAVDGVLGTVRPVGARWLSVLPWWRTDGILLDLLPAVLGASEILRPPTDEPPLADLARLIEARRPTHGVLPLDLVRRLVEHWGGAGGLASFVDGLATGPGLDADLAAVLSATRLRTHRGAPELSHLVTLGEPGAWRPGLLGRPIGCRLEDDVAGSKAVTGVNLCYGTWHDAALTVEDPTRALRVTFS